MQAHRSKIRTSPQTEQPRTDGGPGRQAKARQHRRRAERAGGCAPQTVHKAGMLRQDPSTARTCAKGIYGPGQRQKVLNSEGDTPWPPWPQRVPINQHKFTPSHATSQPSLLPPTLSLAAHCSSWVFLRLLCLPCVAPQPHIPHIPAYTRIYPQPHIPDTQAKGNIMISLMCRRYTVKTGQAWQDPGTNVMMS